MAKRLPQLAAVLVLGAAIQGSLPADKQAVHDFDWYDYFPDWAFTYGWAFRVNQPVEVT